MSKFTALVGKLKLATIINTRLDLSDPDYVVVYTTYQKIVNGAVTLFHTRTQLANIFALSEVPSVDVDSKEDISDDDSSDDEVLIASGKKSPSLPMSNEVSPITGPSGGISLEPEKELRVVQFHDRDCFLTWKHNIVLKKVDDDAFALGKLVAINDLGDRLATGADVVIAKLTASDKKLSVGLGLSTDEIKYEINLMSESVKFAIASRKNLEYIAGCIGITASGPAAGNRCAKPRVASTHYCSEHSSPV